MGNVINELLLLLRTPNCKFTCICWSMQNCHITLQEISKSHLSDLDDSHNGRTRAAPIPLAHATHLQMWTQKAGTGVWGRATRYQSPQLTRTGVVPGMSERPPSVEKVQFLPLCRWWCDQPDLPSTTSSARRSTLEQERVHHFGGTFDCLCSFK